MSHWTAVPLPLLAVLAACGEGEKPRSPEPLRLTDTVSPVITRACETAAERSSLTVACPRIVPADRDHDIHDVGKLGGKRGPADSYSIHVISPSIRRGASDPENPGHWAIDAARSVSTLRKALMANVQVRPARRTLELNGVDVTEYTMPPYPAGGLHGGHVVLLWKGDRAAYLLSVHDPRNRRRALAMASALVADTAGHRRSSGRDVSKRVVPVRE